MTPLGGSVVRVYIPSGSGYDAIATKEIAFSTIVSITGHVRKTIRIRLACFFAKRAARDGVIFIKQEHRRLIIAFDLIREFGAVRGADMEVVTARAAKFTVITSATVHVGCWSNAEEAAGKAIVTGGALLRSGITASTGGRRITCSAAVDASGVDEVGSTLTLTTTITAVAPSVNFSSSATGDSNIDVLVVIASLIIIVVKHSSVFTRLSHCHIEVINIRVNLVP